MTAPRIPADLRAALAMPGAWDRVRALLAPPIPAAIQRPEDALPWLRPLSCGPREVLSVLVLSRRNHVLGASILAIGNGGCCVIDPAEVARAVLSYPRGCSAIIAHNHPSGDPTPSPQDYDVTRKTAAALEMLGLKLLDHLVLTDGPAWASIQNMRPW